MSLPIRYVIRRWWWRKFHPIARIGWRMATMDEPRSTTATVVGLTLTGAGIILRPRAHRKLLYRGVIDPGETTRIRVLSGDDVIHDASYGV